jgi:hypothetical protein
MRTRLRDWIIVGVALALVFGVSLRAPDPPGEPALRRIVRDAPVSIPAPTAPRFRPRPRTVPPFERVDPARFLLYTSPGLDKQRATPRVLPPVR